MKIYNKSAFTFGVLCAAGLSLFALGIISATWWQWVLTVVISCRYLYVGLSKTASAHVEAIHQHNNEVVIQLFG